MLFDGVDFTSSFTLGSVVIAATIGFYALVQLWRGAKYKNAAEVAESNSRIYAEGREAYKQRSERLDEELKDTTAKLVEATTLIGDQKRTIAKLEALPNLQAIVELMADTARRQDEVASDRAKEALNVVSQAIQHQDQRAQQRMEHHEKRAQDRHDQQMEIMQGMTEAIEKMNGHS